jgi:hypothetical protein
MEHNMQNVQTKVIPTAPHAYNGLVFGFDPLKITDAKHIVQHPNDFTQTQCVLAFRTIKESRGETVSPDFISQTLRTAIQIGGAA